MATTKAGFVRFPLPFANRATWPGKGAGIAWASLAALAGAIQPRGNRERASAGHHATGAPGYSMTPKKRAGRGDLTGAGLCPVSCVRVCAGMPNP